jgi:cell wall-associated NlpC family hydrolase
MTRVRRAPLLLAALMAVAAPASGSISSRLSPDRVLALAAGGQSARTILQTAFPGGALRRARPVRLRVLIADLAPRVVLSARSRMSLRWSRRRVPLEAGHRHEIARTGRGWTVRDIDGVHVARLGPGPLRFVPASQATGVFLAEPLARRFRGSLRLIAGEGDTISVANDVGVEDWLAGTVAGEVPLAWLQGAPQAMQAQAVLARSRAMVATAAARDPQWDITSDDLLYLGIDGERPASRAAAARTRGQILEISGVPVDGVFSIPVSSVAPFVPDPGRPQPVASFPAHPIPSAPPGLGPQAVQLALSQVETPYRWGGEDPGGFDCSGLVYWAFGRLGIHLPRVAEDQARVGVPVDRSQLQPGDVVFFADSSGYVHHEGIYIGNGQVVHAPQTGETVRLERIDIGYYDRQYAGARRFSPTA